VIQSILGGLFYLEAMEVEVDLTVETDAKAHVTSAPSPVNAVLSLIKHSLVSFFKPELVTVRSLFTTSIGLR
jgi:hypothetical protein